MSWANPRPWLAYTGRHDGTGDSSAFDLHDHCRQPALPDQWFVRNAPFPCAIFAFMFDEEYELSADEALSLRYRIAIADRERGRPEIDTLADAWHQWCIAVFA